MPPLCCICGESNGVHALPNGKETSRRLEWIKFAGIEKIITEKKHWFLCNKHFEDRMFRTKERKCLVFSAFPTLHPPAGPAIEDGKDAGSVELKEESGHQNTSQPKDNLSFQIKDVAVHTVLPTKDSLLSTNISPPSKISSSTCKNAVSQLASSLKHAESQSGNIESSPSPGICSTKSDIKASSVDTKPKKKIIRLLTSNNSSFSTIVKAVPVKCASSKTNNCILKISPTIKLIPPVSSKTALKSTQTNELSRELETPAIEGGACLGIKSASVNRIKSPTMIDLEPPPIKKSDILLTAINNSDISFSDDSYGGSNINSKVLEGKEDHPVKCSNKPPSRKRKRHYDPALIESILNKMKLKKNGPIQIVTLEKRQDRVIKAYTMNKLVTVYKQQIRKSKKGKKILSGNSGTTKNSPEELKNKRKCTCCVHCHQKPISTQKSPPLVNVNPGIGVQIAGNAINPNIMNIDPYPAYKELLNTEKVFNVSTILTNINDRSQIEQLCQMLIDSIFKLKNLNIERMMAKLEVYISQMPSIGVNDKTTISGSSLDCEGYSEKNHPRNEPLVINRDSNISSGQVGVNFNSANAGCCDPSVTSSDKTNSCAGKQKHSGLYRASSEPLFTNTDEYQIKCNNVYVKLNTFHDHCYTKSESNYIFEKPKYLVKLINIKTYRRNMKARKKVRPLNSSISKNAFAKHRKSHQKLTNKIIHLRNLINKKNRNIKSIYKKMKYLDGVLHEDRGIKGIKYPKNIEEQLLNDSDNIRPEEEMQKNPTGED